MEPGKDKTMTEIEKMYSLAGVKKACQKDIKFEQCIFSPSDCGNYTYPPFTTEKQLEIVQYILFSKWWMNLKRLQFAENFEEALAGLVNDLWQDLTEAEQNDIKRILE